MLDLTLTRAVRRPSLILKVPTQDYYLLYGLPDTCSIGQIGRDITELFNFRCRRRVLTFRDFIQPCEPIFVK
jgi:hypothetical protein